MRKVKYIGDKLDEKYLSADKIYDVVRYRKARKSPELDTIDIIDNRGVLENYFVMYGEVIPVFKDVMAEYRTSVIDGILS